MAEKWKGFTEEDIKNLTNVQPILKGIYEQSIL